MQPTREDLDLLLDALEPAPAYVLDPLWNFLAVNRAQGRLFAGLDRVPLADRNLLWLVFAHPAVRALIGDWELEARQALSQFRADTTAIRNEPAIAELVARLTQASPEFARWWPRHDVAGFESRIRVFHHPVAGSLRFRHEQLVPAARPDLRIIVHLALPGDDSTERLRHTGHVVA